MYCSFFDLFVFGFKYRFGENEFSYFVSFLFWNLNWKERNSDVFLFLLKKKTKQKKPQVSMQWKRFSFAVVIMALIKSYEKCINEPFKIGKALKKITAGMAQECFITLK